MAPDKPACRRGMRPGRAAASGNNAGTQIELDAGSVVIAGPVAAQAPTRRSLLFVLLLVLAVTGAAGWWRDHRALALGPELAAQARPGDIHLLSSQTCVYCRQARQWLTAQRVAFDECFIESDARCAAQYQALQAPGTPVVLVRGQAQLGFSPQQVLERLSASAQPAV